MPVPVRFSLNHEDMEVFVDPTRTFLDVLRHDLGLRGTKTGCEIGYCGACTVVVDGEAVPACLQMTGLLDGRDVVTIEALTTDEGIDPVQRAFVESAGMQCGFCTPGHVMAARALIDSNADPSEDQIAATVDGNYCRCTGYVKIRDSVKRAVALNHASTESETQVQQ